MVKFSFLLGLVVGILLSIVVVLSLPLDWISYKEESYRKASKNLQGKIVIVLGYDENLQYINESRGSFGGDIEEGTWDEWIVNVYQDKQNALRMRESILETLRSKRQIKNKVIISHLFTVEFTADTPFPDQTDDVRAMLANAGLKITDIKIVSRRTNTYLITCTSNLANQEIFDKINNIENVVKVERNKIFIQKGEEKEEFDQSGGNYSDQKKKE